MIAASCKQDYYDCLQRWIRRIEQADVNGDAKPISQGVNTICGKTTSNFSKQSRSYHADINDKKQGETISGPEERDNLWQKFLQDKFKETELGTVREFANIDPNALSEEGGLTIAEFMDAVSKMKTGKTTDPDNVSAEVFKSSTLTKHELFSFLRQVWRHEYVPKNLILCMFVMIYKQKDSHDDLTCTVSSDYHVYKILSIYLLKRTVKETE